MKEQGFGNYWDDLESAIRQEDNISVEIWTRNVKSTINGYTKTGKYKEAYELLLGTFNRTSNFINEANFCSTEDPRFFSIAQLFPLCHDAVRFGWEEFNEPETQERLTEMLSWCDKFNLEEERWKILNNMLVLGRTRAINLPPPQAKEVLEGIIKIYRSNVIRRISRFTRGTAHLQEDTERWADIRNNVGLACADSAFYSFLLGDEDKTRLDEAQYELDQSLKYVSPPYGKEDKLRQIRAQSNMVYVQYIRFLSASKAGGPTVSHLSHFTSGLETVINRIERTDARERSKLQEYFDAEIHIRMLQGVIIVLSREGTETRPLLQLMSSFYSGDTKGVEREEISTLARRIYQEARKTKDPQDTAELKRVVDTIMLFGLAKKLQN